jgi:hypothetical protein
MPARKSALLSFEVSVRVKKFTKTGRGEGTECICLFSALGPRILRVRES